MKKIIKKMLAVCVSVMTVVSAMTICVSAAETPVSKGDSVMASVKISSGTYYSTSNPGSFIKIYSSSSDCMVYLVVDSGGQRICGNGTYSSSLGMDHIVYLTLKMEAWHYENDTTIVNSPSPIDAIYDGNITLLYNGEVFSK